MATEEEKIAAFKRIQGLEHLTDEECKKVVLERLRNGVDIPHVKYRRSQIKSCK